MVEYLTSAHILVDINSGMLFKRNLVLMIAEIFPSSGVVTRPHNIIVAAVGLIVGHAALIEAHLHGAAVGRPFVGGICRSHCCAKQRKRDRHLCLHSILVSSIKYI